MSEERDGNYDKGNIYLVYVAIGDTDITHERLTKPW